MTETTRKSEPLFQVVAKGPYACFCSEGFFVSKTLFTTREKAEQRIEKFRIMVTSPERGLSQLDDCDQLKITIEEREIVE